MQGPAIQKPRSTSDAILDAAETLWAKDSYDGVSLRKITTLAGAELSLAHYHFGSKENLFRSVVERRSADLRSIFDHSFDTAWIKAAPALPTIKNWIGAFIDPLFHLLYGDEPEWHNYARVICRHAIVDQTLPYLNSYHDHASPIMDRFLEGCKQILPEWDDDRLFWTTYFLNAGALAVYQSNTLMYGLKATAHRNTTDYLVVKDAMASCFAAAFEHYARK